MPTLNALYWENRYQQGQTGWDMGSAGTPLTEYCKQINSKKSHILIPGCGNAYESSALLDAGFKNITLLDFAETPVNDARTKFSEAINDGRLKVICEDFFEHNATYDLILEQTFFCAIHPAMRPGYAKQMFNLLNPNGKLAGVLFDFPLTDEGPPFGGNMDVYKEYFSPYFAINKIEKCYNSIKPRQDRELFFILQKSN
ncbi:MAG: methyltransferase [Bacteroidia bacterium]|nr:methyltransferase [Bacteroidia bacterium]